MPSRGGKEFVSGKVTRATIRFCGLLYMKLKKEDAYISSSCESKKHHRQWHLLGHGAVEAGIRILGVCVLVFNHAVGGVVG